MSDDQNNNNLWGVLLAAGVAAAAGIWVWTREENQSEEPPTNLEAEERQAIDHLTGINPSDSAALNAALAHLNVIRAKRKILEYQNTPNPMTPEMESALIEMRRYQFDESLEGRQACLAATARYIAATQQAVLVDMNRANTGQINSAVPYTETHHQVRRYQCGYCNGAGWYICFACQGTGKNRLMPPPRYTGDARFDALIAFNHNDTCQSCKGSPQITCNHCNGIGYR